jgi:hypothetical protein
MAEVTFLENRLRSWMPVLAQTVEDEIRQAAAPHPGSLRLDCRIRLEDGDERLAVGILLEREGWGARFVVPFPSLSGEVLSCTERVLRERVLA